MHWGLLLVFLNKFATFPLVYSVSNRQSAEMSPLFFCVCRILCTISMTTCLLWYRCIGTTCLFMLHPIVLWNCCVGKLYRCIRNHDLTDRHSVDQFTFLHSSSHFWPSPACQQYCPAGIYRGFHKRLAKPYIHKALWTHCKNKHGILVRCKRLWSQPEEVGFCVK